MLLLVLSGLWGTRAPSAQADSTILCSGYSGCATAGYSPAGYRAQAGTMWWRMYTGHNCTNYAAYRLVRNGMPNTRPWSGSGNASNWGVAMKSITDGKPMVGAIAWWKANVAGAGRSGHVAYVQQVVSSTEIIVSEDSWGGDFHWRRITKSGRGWPSGFIHFKDSAVTNTAAPTVSSTPTVGKTATAATGTWKFAAAYAYQWELGGKAIAGATARTYVPTAAQSGRNLRVKVTGTRAGYVTGTAYSAPVKVTPGGLAPTSQPQISGEVNLDQTLSVAGGTWSPAATSTSIQWYADGVAVPGATGASLVLGADQVGKTIKVAVTGRRAGYKAAVLQSAATTPVLAGSIEVTESFKVTGAVRTGSVLKAARGTYAPGDATVTHTWLRGGAPIPGANGPSYRLSGADIGRTISVQVKLSRPGFRGVVQTAGTKRRVRAVPTVKVNAVGGKRRAVVAVRVRAPGAAALPGKVTVRIAGRSVTARLVDGRARFVVPRLVPGRKVVRVVYAGTSNIRAKRAQAAVQVTR